MRLPRRNCLYGSIFCAAALATSAWGQTSLGEIVGAIKDSSGAPVPHVTVVITNEATGVKTNTASNDDGAYSAEALDPGTYRIDATSAGFKSYAATHIELRTGQILREDITLQVGTLNQQVEVVGQAGAAEVQTDSGALSDELGFQTVQEMPTESRKGLELVELTPGVTMLSIGTTQGQELPFFSIAGNPGPRGAMYLMDGTSTAFPRVQGNGGNLPGLNPPIEVMEDMRIVSNSYSAEFGQGIGGVVIMTSKSGTNSLHGDAYYFGQNNDIDARNFFSSNVPELRYDNFGVVVGGPFKKDRTFFLYNYEREINLSGSPAVLTLPSLLQRQGNFSQTYNANGGLDVIYEPNSTQTLPSGSIVRTPYPGNIIPATSFDSVAANILNNYMPAPNQPGTLTGANNFLRNRLETDVHRNWNFGRIDENLTDNDKLYGRVTVDQPNYPEGGAYKGISGAEDADPNDLLAYQEMRTVGAGYTKVFSPTLLSDFRFGFVSFNMNFEALGDNPAVWDQNWAGKLGLQNLSIDTFPYFQPSGYEGIGGTGADFGGRQQLIYKVFTAYQLGETLSWQKGRHFLHFGGEYIRSRGVFASRVWPSGDSTYDPRATALPGVANTGNSIASMLLGQVATATIEDEPAPDLRTWFVAGFIQDDWRVTDHLTVNLGLRYEFDFPKEDLTNSQNFFNANAINPACNCPGAIIFSQNLYAVTQSSPQLYNAQPLVFDPRVGFAWTPFKKDDLVVRGGYGIFYAGADYGDTFWDPPMAGTGKQGTWTTDGLGLTPAFILSQGYPAPPQQPLNNAWGAVAIGQSPVYSPQYWYSNRRVIYDEQWNFNIEKPFGKTLIEIGYLGNAGKHLPDGAYNANQLLPELMGPGNAQIRLPFPQFGNVTGYGYNNETSLYHAGLVAVRRHYSNGLSFEANYTLSRFLDDQSYKRSDYDRLLDYGPSSLQRRNVFIFSSVYELPFGKGRSLLTDGIGSKILGGWRLGGFAQAQSGQPLNFSNTDNTCNCYTNGTQGVNISGPVRLTSNFNPGSSTWFNTSVFSNPAAYTFGNAGPGLIDAPGLFTINTNLTRRFPVTERLAIEFRMDAFNLLNWVNFNAPSTTYGSPGFGNVTSAQSGRILQYAAKFFF
jgi:hypothetical protein